MGTNYYLKSKEPIVTHYPAFLNLPPKTSHLEFHIGKNSGGWKFKFRDGLQESHGIEKSFSSIEDFQTILATQNWVISNEYGEDVNPTVFWMMVMSSNSPDNSCHYTYCVENYGKHGHTETRLDGYGFSWVNTEFF